VLFLAFISIAINLRPLTVVYCIYHTRRYDRHIALVPRFRGQEKLPSHLRPSYSSSSSLADVSTADLTKNDDSKTDDTSTASTTTTTTTNSSNNSCDSKSGSFNTVRDPLWLMGTTSPSNYDRRTPFPLPQTWTHYLAPVNMMMLSCSFPVFLMQVYNSSLILSLLFNAQMPDKDLPSG